MDLAKLRLASKFPTRPALAAAVGCHPQQIYNFEEKGDTIPYKYLSAYAKALGVKYIDLHTFACTRVLNKYTSSKK